MVSLIETLRVKLLSIARETGAGNGKQSEDAASSSYWQRPARSPCDS
jgi:hypothetical protein